MKHTLFFFSFGFLFLITSASAQNLRSTWQCVQGLMFTKRISSSGSGDENAGGLGVFRLTSVKEETSYTYESTTEPKCYQFNPGFKVGMTFETSDECNLACNKERYKSPEEMGSGTKKTSEQ